MLITSVLLAGCGSAAPTPAPTPPSPPAAVVAPEKSEPPRDVRFPDGWTGVWKGPLRIETTGKPSSTLEMELHIQPLAEPDRWTWKIVYAGQPRDYVLIAVDRAGGRYQVDERNSIVLDAILVDGTLFSQFTVMNNFIQARYTNRGATLEFEIVMVSMKTPNKTGGSGAPDVESFPVRVVQRASLYRVSPARPDAR